MVFPPQSTSIAKIKENPKSPAIPTQQITQKPGFESVIKPVNFTAKPKVKVVTQKLIPRNVIKCIFCMAPRARLNKETHRC
jgi:hypothetical protein